MVGRLSVISSFQALKKVLVTDLFGSQDQNKHDLNKLRQTALEDGQENHLLEKVNLSMPLNAPRCASHLSASWECSLSPGSWLNAQEEIERHGLIGVGPEANVPAASLLPLEEAGFESRLLQPPLEEQCEVRWSTCEEAEGLTWSLHGNQ